MKLCLMECEKVEKNQDLAKEILRVWKTSTNVISIVVGELGPVASLDEYMRYRSLLY